MKVIVTLFLITLTLLQLKAKAKDGVHPNVLLIFTDDHRYTGVHALGGQAVKTPSLDALAENGIVFTNTYLQGAFVGATCMPSRAMLMTGRDLFHLDGTGHNIPLEQTTIGEAFKNSGYYTEMIGKWHQDFKSLVRSFDHGEKIMGHPLYLTDHFRMPFSDWHPNADFKKEDCYLLEYDDQGNIVRRPVNENDKPGPFGTEKTGPHTSEVFADEAINFISNYNKKQPFFMYLAFHAPHDPRQAPQKYRDMYPPGQIQLTPSYMPEHPFDNGHFFLRDEELAPWPRTPEIARQQLADYYSIITHLDAQIGRVIQALKESGQYENTIIIMSGDSGLGVGNHGLLGKQNVYDEDGLHVPLIISGGLVKDSDRGSRDSALCYTYDIMPTALDLAGVKIPESVEGKSLLPVINGEVTQIRDYTYHAYRQHQRAYRKGNFKLIEYVRAPVDDWKLGHFIAGSRVTQLFNVKNDSWEVNNLAYFPKYKELLETMKSEMKEKAKELGDVADGKRTKYDFWEYY